MLYDGVKVTDIVTIDYSAKLHNGQTVLSTKVDGPLTFIVGNFGLVKGLNEAVLGMKIGESKDLIIPYSMAFGEVKNHLIIEKSLNDLPKFIRLGQKIKLRGSKHFYTVLNVSTDEGLATLDANHLLAGQNLKFSLKILSVKYPPQRKEPINGEIKSNNDKKRSGISEKAEEIRKIAQKKESRFRKERFAFAE